MGQGPGIREFNRLYKELDDLYHNLALRQGLSDSASIILYALYFTLRDMYLLAKDRAMNRPVAEEKPPREEDAPGEDETPENGTDEPNQTADEKTDGDSRPKRKRTSRKRQNQKKRLFYKKGTETGGDRQ